MSAFNDFSLLKSLQDSLRELKLTRPTEIQVKTIPALLERRSLVGIAETGSGKTLAYALPILHLLKTLENEGDAIKDEGRPRALVIVPTRELGEQVSKVFKQFTHGTRLRVRSVLGGTAMQVAKENVKGAFEVLVATPGRLVQMLPKRQVDLSDVRICIFDEADQMVDEGFVASATRIISECPEILQLALFSATVSPSVQEIITTMFEGVEVMRTVGASRVPASLQTENLTVIDGKRFPLLKDLLGEKVEGGTLIFTNTREQCDRLAEDLEKAKIDFTVYRGEMDKIERRNNLKAFINGEVQVLISTDLASRGLDVEHVGRVINYHMPQMIESYLHRVGRTARAGRSGRAINFITERDETMLEQIKSVRALPRK